MSSNSFGYVEIEGNKIKVVTGSMSEPKIQYFEPSEEWMKNNIKTKQDKDDIELINKLYEKFQGPILGAIQHLEYHQCSSQERQLLRFLQQNNISETDIMSAVADAVHCREKHQAYSKPNARKVWFYISAICVCSFTIGYHLNFIITKLMELLK